MMVINRPDGVQTNQIAAADIRNRSELMGYRTGNLQEPFRWREPLRIGTCAPPRMRLSWRCDYRTQARYAANR